ncbi:hypothetical protein KKG72_09760 [bacterium]|nr:hypothetical protein [bacterium]MBU1993864.1 hypothetical protein [bacterium]
MILKLLLIIGVIAIIYFVFFKKKPLQNNNNSHIESNDMIECSACGIYSEVDDSILSNGKYYCSPECLKKS